MHRESSLVVFFILVWLSDETVGENCCQRSLSFVFIFCDPFVLFLEKFFCEVDAKVCAESFKPLK